MFEYLGYVTDTTTGQTTITFRVTNKCARTAGFVAIGTDSFTRTAPANGSVYAGSLGTYDVSWTSTNGNPGFASIKFQPTFDTFGNGASDLFSIAVSNSGFNPNTTIQVAGKVGGRRQVQETYSFLLSQTSCPPR